MSLHDLWNMLASLVLALVSLVKLLVDLVWNTRLSADTLALVFCLVVGFGLWAALENWLARRRVRRKAQREGRPQP